MTVGKSIIRIFLMSIVAGACLIPLLTISLEEIRYIVVLLFIGIVIPILLFTLYVMTIYDKLVFWVQECMGWND